MTFTETPEELQVATDAAPDIETEESGDNEYSTPIEIDNAEWQSKAEQKVQKLSSLNGFSKPSEMRAVILCVGKPGWFRKVFLNVLTSISIRRFQI